MPQSNPHHENIKSTKSKKKPKRPKKITKTYLYNSGLYYLQRFSASKNHFQNVMERKIKTSCAYHKEQSYEECLQLLPPLIEQFEEAGLLNDKAYATGLINSLRRRGLSHKAILMKAKQKGLPNNLAQDTLKIIDSEYGENTQEADLHAAIALAKKKRLGPFTIEKPNQDKEKIQTRQLSALARAGYSYDIAKKILEMSIEDIQEITDN